MVEVSSGCSLMGLVISHGPGTEISRSVMSLQIGSTHSEGHHFFPQFEVCDIYFVSAIEVVTKRFKIPDDVSLA